MDIEIIGSDKNWIEGEAVEQLKAVAKLPEVTLAYGMPDLHPGRGYPIGCVVGTEGKIYPQLAGNDIGCGMALYSTDLKAKNLKLDRLVKKLKDLETPLEEDKSPWLEDHNATATSSDLSLGTIGGGNHFAEIQVVQEVFDPEALAETSIDEKSCLLLVHSGSRGYGEAILQQALRLSQDGLSEEEAAAYLREHNNAIQWAKANRTRIAERLADQMHCEAVPVLDICHNWIEKKEIAGKVNWLHRKGAAPADQGIMVIPGSRGTLTYLIKPLAKVEEIAWTLAHGAGRKWSRSHAEERIKKRYQISELERTPLQGRVICEDKKLIFEEAPDAYKNLEIIIQDLVDLGYISVIATLAPKLTYKTRRVK